jgi:hypothetical protein
MLPTLPKIPVKGEKVGVCKTTSAEYKTPKTQIIYLVPDILREYGLVWREADQTLERRIIKWAKREVDATADIMTNCHWPEVEGRDSLDSLDELGVIPAKVVVVIRMVQRRNGLLKLTRWDLYDNMEIIISGDFRKPMWNFECRLVQLLSKSWEVSASLA